MNYQQKVAEMLRSLANDIENMPDEQANTIQIEWSRPPEEVPQTIAESVKGRKFCAGPEVTLWLQYQSRPLK